jgi:tellurite resistance protein
MVWIIAIGMALWLISVIIDSMGEAEPDAQEELVNLLARGLQVTVKKEQFTSSDQEDAIPVYSVWISGTVMVPQDEAKCQLVVQGADATDDLEGDAHYPVLCQVPELRDENGFFESRDPVEVPHQVSSYESVEILKIPSEALLFPKRGNRSFCITVFLLPSNGKGDPYSAGSTSLNHCQSFYGYLEMEKANKIADQAVALLALCVCMSDGRIDNQEAAVLRDFFRERYAMLDADERKSRREAVNHVIHRFKKTYHSQGTGGGRELWQKTCRKIRDLDSERTSQDAYELCVKLVASDGKAHPRELLMLQDTAGMLGISDELDREFRERHFKIGMFEHERAGELLAMPEGLSREEKIAFLNREYQKWRRRVTHADPEISLEAELRLKKIAEIRRRLEEQ